jgi:predicted nucleic acid-binding protein
VLIGVDSNVLLDLAEAVEDVTDAFLTIRCRLPHAQLIMLPTAGHELAAEVKRGSETAKRQRARRAFQLARDWHIHPADLISVRHGIAERIGRHLRDLGLLPETETNDGLILAEAALLNCSLLLTSDEHLRGIDFQRLTFEFQSFDVTAPVIATPREIVRKFFH